MNSIFEAKDIEQSSVFLNLLDVSAARAYRKPEVGVYYLEIYLANKICLKVSLSDQEYIEFAKRLRETSFLVRRH